MSNTYSLIIDRNQIHQFLSLIISINECCERLEIKQKILNIEDVISRIYKSKNGIATIEIKTDLRYKEISMLLQKAINNHPLLSNLANIHKTINIVKLKNESALYNINKSLVFRILEGMINTNALSLNPEVLNDDSFEEIK